MTSTKSNRTRAARRAARVRKARDTFFSQYGWTTYDVVQGVVTGKTVSLVNARRLAAYKANLTRGTYLPFVSATGSGSCNF